MTNKIFFIAEIGINHNGSVKIAKNLIKMAKEVGFDAVKFQKREPELCVPKEQRNILRDTPWGTMTYLQYRKKLEFGKNEYDEIDKYCRQLDIDWFASAWDLPSLKFLAQYDLKYNKIASPMITYKPLLEAVASEGRYTFISTGMSTWDIIDTAVDIFREAGCPFMLMHSVSIYPCPEYLCNIRMIETLRKRYHCDVGYSGHEEGLIPSVLAVAHGASAIERHITLDRAMWGTDQSASLERRGQELLIRDCKSVKLIQGSGNYKKIYDDEKKKIIQLRWWEK